MDILTYLSENAWQAWTLLAVVCLILELTSGDFFILCFSIGGAATAILSACGLGFYGCLAVFAAVSVLCLFFVRPALLKRVHNKPQKISNGDAIIGRTGKVSETIEPNGYGRVKLDGDDWKAQSADGCEIAAGTKVEIVARESIIVTVTPA